MKPESSITMTASVCFLHSSKQLNETAGQTLTVVVHDGACGENGTGDVM
jgi:hypothetical protein